MAGLLGMDDASDIGTQLQGLLSSLGPSAADQAAAKRMALIQLGASLLGAHRGYEMGTLGQAIPQAMGTYQNTLTQLPKLRAEQLQGVLPLMQMIQTQQQMKRMNDALNAPNASSAVPTQNGPDAAFQQPGGAQSLFGGALGDQQAPPASLPQQVPVPGAVSPQQAQYQALANANIVGMAGGRPDMSAAIKTKFPMPIAQRPNAPVIDQFGNVISPPAPVPPSGSRYDPATKSFIPVGGAPQALAAPTVAKNLAQAATEPQQGVLPGGGEGVIGTKLGAMGGAAGPYSFLNNVLGGQAAPQAGAPRSGPVQTKLSPEQTSNSEALGQDRGAYRAAMDQSSKAVAQLDQINDTLKYFKPGPTLPIRSDIAGYAQEVPGIGRSIADALVPNSATALPAIAAMEKFGVGLTAEQSKVFGSREGQQVIGMIKSAMPNAAQVPGAPETIIAAQKGVHQWIIDKGHAAEQWVKNPAHNNSLDGFSDAWDQVHPVSQYVGNLPALANIAAGRAPGDNGSQASGTIGGQTSQQGGKQVLRTGTLNGRKVVQYSDGTTAFAQ